MLWEVIIENTKKEHDRNFAVEKRMAKWLSHYRTKTRPQLINGYTQRINTFITKLQQNPKELNKYEAPDVREQKQEHLKERLSEMEMKGGRMFRFRDTVDFSSFYGPVERIERQWNKSLFEKKYGDTRMACRSIASQSLYNPKTQFRDRDRSKEINPPMKYTNKISPSLFIHRKSKSVVQSRKRTENKTELSRQEEYDHENMVRRSTSVSNSAFGEQLTRSMNSVRQGSQSSQESYKNLKKFQVTLKDHNKEKKKESGKSYFIGISDIKLNCKDPHLKKTLHSILVKIGKNRPNPRDKGLASHVEELSNEMN